MTQVWVMTHGWYEVDKIEIFATSEAAEKEHQKLLDHQNAERQEYEIKYGKNAPLWMSRDNWQVEAYELRE